MPIAVEEEFRRGGRTLLDFLTFCVMSIRMEPVFAFLAAEYRQNPTREKALALFDCFCAPDAPARLRHPAELLPPRNVRFASDVEVFRAPISSSQLAGATHQTHAEPPVPVDPALASPLPRHLALPPPRYLFDFLTDAFARLDPNPVDSPGADFDPTLSPVENLPGGRMTAGQRAFVDRIWQPRVRLELVRVGFWRIGNV